jgi:hypothetical protein
MVVGTDTGFATTPYGDALGCTSGSGEVGEQIAGFLLCPWQVVGQCWFAVVYSAKYVESRWNASASFVIDLIGPTRRVRRWSGRSSRCRA